MPRSCWCPYGTPGLASIPGKEHVAPPPAAGDPRAKLAPTPWAVLGPATRPAARRAGKCLPCVLDGGDSGVRRRPQSVTFVLTRHPGTSSPRLRTHVYALSCGPGPGRSCAPWGRAGRAGVAAPLLPSLQQGAPRGDPARSPRAKGLVTAARGGHHQASRGEKRGPLRLGGVTGGEPAEAAGGSWPPGPRPLPCHVEATRGQRGQPVLTAFAPSCCRLLSGTRQTIRKLISGRDNHGRFLVLRRHSRSTCKGPAGETGWRCGVPGSTGHKHGCYRS